MRPMVNSLQALNEAMVSLGEQREEVVVCISDTLKTMGMDGFVKRFPDRLFDFGIAEQLSSGLPSEELRAEVLLRKGTCAAMRSDALAAQIHLLAALRIAREAVANAARHGRPESISVELREGALRVVDDGCGFDPARSRPGFGLASMRERAAAVGAALDVASAPGKGASVVVAWP